VVAADRAATFFATPVKHFLWLGRNYTGRETVMTACATGPAECDRWGLSYGTSEGPALIIALIVLTALALMAVCAVAIRLDRKPTDRDAGGS
jgi:hypothetical protein